MRGILFFITLYIGCPIFSSAQENPVLTATEKAYLFHTIRKSPILQNSLGEYIQYLGTIPTFPNGEINYDSIEYRIRQYPDSLLIFHYDLRRANKGVLAELTNKMAIWELNSMLMVRRNDSIDAKGFTHKYASFKQLLLKRLPQKAVYNKEGKTMVKKAIRNTANPVLSFDDKVAMLNAFSKWTISDKISVLKAYDYAVNQWVTKRSYYLFTILGGVSTQFENILTAAGDGAITSGKFEWRDAKAHGWWNVSLPQTKGFFMYESEVQQLQDAKQRKKKEKIAPSSYTIQQYQTNGNGKETIIHLDVWGYDPNKQNTVVIAKGNHYYPLFGIKESRFLSPDSIFEGGITYYSIIHQFERKRDSLENLLSGKKGIEYWLAYYKEKKLDTKLEIQKAEHDLFTVRKTQYETNPDKLKYSKKRNGIKRKQRNHNKDELILFSDDPVKQPRNKGMDAVSFYQGQLQRIKKKIERLEVVKEKISALKHQVTVQIQLMKFRIGVDNQWVCFEQRDGLYIYDDGARFDIRTQEFTFPAADTQAVFEVKLLSVPTSYKQMNDRGEVMLHVNILQAIQYYDAQIYWNKSNAFTKNGTQIADSIKWIQTKDSLAIKELFDALLNRKKDFIVTAIGGGIGTKSHHLVVSDTLAKVLEKYPDGKAGDSTFSELRNTRIIWRAKRNIQLMVANYTDPVACKFTPKNENIATLIQTYHLTENQMISAARTVFSLQKLIREMRRLAKVYLPEKKAKKVIKKMDKTLRKVRVKVGPTAIKIKYFSI